MVNTFPTSFAMLYYGECFLLWKIMVTATGLHGNSALAAGP